MRISREPIKIDFSWQEVLVTLALITFYVPADYAIPGIIYKLWRLAYTAVSIAAVGIYLLGFHKKISLRYLAFIAFFSWLFVGTAFFGANGVVAKFLFIKCIGYVTALELAFQMLPKRKVARSFLTSGLIMCGIHFITFLMYSHLEGGMRHGQTFEVYGKVYKNSSQNWFFLTYDNDSIYYFLPVAALLLFYAHNYRMKTQKIAILYIGFILFMFLSKMAVTASISMLLLTALFLYYEYQQRKNGLRKVRIRIGYWKSFFIGIGFSILVIAIVGGGISGRIAEFFGKDGSFSGRDKIWAKSLKYFIQYPLFGEGIENGMGRILKLGQSHCHNIFLELMFDGGLVALILLFVVVYMFRPRKSHATNTYSSYIFSSALLAYFITAGIDWLYSDPIPYALFYFSYFFTENSLIDGLKGEYSHESRNRYLPMRR